MGKLTLGHHGSHTGAANKRGITVNSHAFCLLYKRPDPIIVVYHTSQLLNFNRIRNIGGPALTRQYTVDM